MRIVALIFCSIRNVCDLEFVDNFANEVRSVVCFILNRQGDSMGMSGKCKDLLQDWIGSNVNIFIAGKEMSELD